MLGEDFEGVGEREQREPMDLIGESAAAPKKPRSKRSRPKVTIPPVRLTIDKQLAALAAYASLSEQGRVRVEAAKAAKAIQVSANTIYTYNAFFRECGFLSSEPGKASFVPTPPLFEFLTLWSRGDTESALLKLGPGVSDTWFGRAILTQVRIRPRTENELIAELAVTAGVTDKTYDRAFKVLVEWCERTGVIHERDGKYSVGILEHAAPTRPSAPAGVPAQVESALPTRPLLAMERMVVLRSGGEIRLGLSVDLFDLSVEDREFVMKLVDLMREYDKSEKHV